ncbi:hypothetical protein M3J07_001764 [Ascochyta lentis]
MPSGSDIASLVQSRSKRKQTKPKQECNIEFPLTSDRGMEMLGDTCNSCCWISSCEERWQEELVWLLGYVMVQGRLLLYIVGFYTLQ